MKKSNSFLYRKLFGDYDDDDDDAKLQTHSSVDAICAYFLVVRVIFRSWL